MRRVATIMMAMVLAVPAAAALPGDAIHADSDDHGLDRPPRHGKGVYRLRVNGNEGVIDTLLRRDDVRKVSFGKVMSHKPGQMSRCGPRCRRWPNKLMNSERQYPQGLTGSNESRWGALAGRREIVVASWYQRRTEDDHTSVGSSVKFISTKSWKFRSVPMMMAVPYGSSYRLERLRAHAGGAAWAGRYLYIADTDRMHRFDLRQIMRTRNGPFLLADRVYVGIDKEPFGKARLSSVSTDWSGKPSLVTAEYADASKGEVRTSVVRWPIGKRGALRTGRRGVVQSRHNLFVDKDSNIDNVQGVESHRGTYLFSCSGGTDRLERRRVESTALRAHFDWRGDDTPQDLYGAVGRRLYGHTEGRYNRRVFWRSFSHILHD